MYKLVGGDQKEYGPVTSEQVRQWIAQGRANGQTLASFEGSPWKPLSSYPEFADALRASSPPPIAQAAPVAGGPVYSTIPGVTGPRTNTAAVSGLVLSILGTCCMPFSLIGLILSIIGLSQIQKNPAAYTTTKVIPIAGIIVALLNVILMIIAYATGAFEEIFRNLPR